MQRLFEFLLSVALVGCSVGSQNDITLPLQAEHALSLTTEMAADGVLGQLDYFSSNSPILDDQSIYAPVAVTKLGDHVLVADAGNNRVLGFRMDETGNLAQRATVVIGQTSMTRDNFTGVANDQQITPQKLAVDEAGRLYVAGTNSDNLWRIFVYDNPFENDSVHEYELLDLPQTVTAMGAIASDRFVVIGGASTSDQTLHFYATGHLEAPPLRQADVPSPCNGLGGARDFLILQNYFTVACAADIYAAPVQPQTGFLEPSPVNSSVADWTHVLTGFSDIGAIAGVAGIVDGQEREEAFVVETVNHRIIPLPRPVYYIDTRRDGLQAQAYNVSVHLDFRRYLGHADLTNGPVDPAAAQGPNYHPWAEFHGTATEWGLYSPRDIAWSGTDIWVADQNNHRVVQFATSIANLTLTGDDLFRAVQVIGQVDFTHNHANRLDGRSFLSVENIALVSDGPSTHLLATDSGAHRAVVHSLAGRVENGAQAQSATLRGQDDLHNYLPNGGEPEAHLTGFNNPTCIDTDKVSDRVAICDYNNQRILVYEAYNSGAMPVAVLGLDETDSFAPQQAFVALAMHGNFVYAAAGQIDGDPNAHRILVYDIRNLTTEDGSADSLYLPHHVIGESFNSVAMPENRCNQNDMPGPDTLCDVAHLATDNTGALWVSDRGNNRILVFNDPVSHLQGEQNETGRLESRIADAVLGQPNMLTQTAFNGSGNEAASRFVEVGDLALTGGENPALWAIDRGNRRLLYFPTPLVPTSNTGMPAASHALGSSMAGSVAGTPKPHGANVADPKAVAVTPDGGLVFVADQGFNRILRFTLNGAPTLHLEDSAGQNIGAHIQVPEGASVSVRVIPSDPEDDSVSVQLEGESAALSFDQAASLLTFNAAELPVGYKFYATLVGTDDSMRANLVERPLVFEVVSPLAPAPTQASSAPARGPEEMPDGGCQAIPLGWLWLVFPILLIYRRRP